VAGWRSASRAPGGDRAAVCVGSGPSGAGRAAAAGGWRAATVGGWRRAEAGVRVWGTGGSGGMGDAVSYPVNVGLGRK
jgi:hypothetical protein